MAQPQTMDLRERFAIQKLPGKTLKTFLEYVPTKLANGKTSLIRQEVQKEVDAGYMVFTPMGSVTHFFTKEAMEHAGFSGKAGFVDMNTGEVISKQEFSLLDKITMRQGNVLPTLIESKGQERKE